MEIPRKFSHAINLEYKKVGPKNNNGAKNTYAARQLHRVHVGVRIQEPKLFAGRRTMANGNGNGRERGGHLQQPPWSVYKFLTTMQPEFKLDFLPGQ